MPHTHKRKTTKKVSKKKKSKKTKTNHKKKKATIKSQNPWIQHVHAFRETHPKDLTWSEALQLASDSYKKQKKSGRGRGQRYNYEFVEKAKETWAKISTKGKEAMASVRESLSPKPSIK